MENRVKAKKTKNKKQNVTRDQVSSKCFTKLKITDKIPFNNLLPSLYIIQYQDLILYYKLDYNDLFDLQWGRSQYTQLMTQ